MNEPISGTRMIVIYDPSEDATQPFKGIEEIREGADPEAIFVDAMKDLDIDDGLEYMFIHPVSGAVIQAAMLPDWDREETGIAISDYKMNLCTLIEVDPTFSIESFEIRERNLEYKNRWVVYEDGRDPMS